MIREMNVKRENSSLNWNLIVRGSGFIINLQLQINIFYGTADCNKKV
jgi:hypothetical protein